MSVSVRPAVLKALAGTLAAFLAASTASADCPVFQVPIAPSTWGALDFVVPPDCHLMLVKVWGNGANAGWPTLNPGYGGGGAALTAVYEVQAGQRFRAEIEENWGNNPGSGGKAGRLYALPPSPAPPTPLLLAGGGGGGGASAFPAAAPPHGGAGGGMAGRPGVGTVNTAGVFVGAGLGGTQSAGGQPGVGPPPTAATGSAGGPFPCHANVSPFCGDSNGGKGGQGYYGGGAGGWSVWSNGPHTGNAGGGGGSSLVQADPRLVYSRRFDGDHEMPGNALDPHRAGAGMGSVHDSQNPGRTGRVVVMFDALDVDPAKTTRWKPMRSEKPIDIEFDSPIELASATLEITDPDGAAVFVDSQPLEQLATNPAYRYKLPWKGPWTAGGERLPAGNYTVVVRGTPVGATWEMKSQPYGRISLVEVKEIKLEPAQGGTFEDNPNGGLRIFAEAIQPADVNPSAEIFNKVKVTATVEPAMPDAATLLVPITVSFKSLDVDDPAGGPIDTTHPIDNRGTPPEGSWTGGASGIPLVDGKATATLTVSMRQGDNYRVAASTKSTWLEGLDPVGGVQDGSVWHVADGVIPEGPNLSKMLTVWRTLHVELSRMDTDPYVQSQFQINGNWTSAGGKLLVDSSAPFYSYSNVDGTHDHELEDEWKGSDLIPNVNTGTPFLVDKNIQSRVTIVNGNLAPPVTDPLDHRYWLRDDLFETVTSAQHLVELAAYILGEVYIRVEQMQGPFPLRPFKHNLLTEEADTALPFHSNSDSYWRTALVLAFEGALSGDFDPAKSSDGATPVSGVASRNSAQPVAFTFLETIRDWKLTGSGPCQPSVSMTEYRESNMAHELMHTLTLTHDGDHTGALMCGTLKNLITTPNRLKVTEAQKRRLRSFTKPNTQTPGNDNCALVNPSCPPIG